MKNIKIYARIGKKGVALYSSYSNGLPIPARRSLGIFVSQKDWDFKKGEIKRSHPQKDELDREINEKISQLLAVYNGVYIADENQDFLSYIEQRIKFSLQREISKSKYESWLRNLRWAVNKVLQTNTLPIKDLRKVELLRNIREALSINRKNPDEKKGNTAFVDVVKFFARYIELWNRESETQYKINTSPLLSDLPKKTSKPAQTLNLSEVIQFSTLPTNTNVQKLALNTFMFQFIAGGLRIQDTLLLTNHCLQKDRIIIQVMKNRAIFQINYSMELIETFSLKYGNELQKAKNEFNILELNTDYKTYKIIDGYILNWLNRKISYLELIDEINELIRSESETSELGIAFGEFKEIVQKSVIDKFINEVSAKPVDFIFPYLKISDFQDSLKDTMKFTKRQNQIIHNSRQKYLQALRRLCEKNNFPVMSGHSARHSYAGLLNELGYGIPEIKDVLAHLSEKTTAIYVANRLPKAQPSKTIKATTKLFQREQLRHL